MTNVSALIFLTPVFALLLSSLLLDERLTQFQWAGVVLTLISVYLINQRDQIAAWVAGVGQAAAAVEEAIEAAVEEAIAPGMAAPAIAKKMPPPTQTLEYEDPPLPPP